MLPDARSSSNISGGNSPGSWLHESGLGGWGRPGEAGTEPGPPGDGLAGGPGAPGEAPRSQPAAAARCQARLTWLSIRGVQPVGTSGPHWENCLGPHIKYIATHYHKKISMF